MDINTPVCTANECPVWALGAVYVSEEVKREIQSARNIQAWLEDEGDTQYAEDV